MPHLTRAIAIALAAHADQSDKGGNPYILHPLRVMLSLESEEARIAAVLHDVVEDSEWTLERLRGEGFSENVLAALEVVTKREGEAYDDFVRRAARHPLGKAVKAADLRDNCDMSRIAEPSARDLERLERYRKALAVLEEDAPAPKPAERG